MRPSAGEVEGFRRGQNVKPDQVRKHGSNQEVLIGMHIRQPLPFARLYQTAQKFSRRNVCHDRNGSLVRNSPHQSLTSLGIPDFARYPRGVLRLADRLIQLRLGQAADACA